MRASTSIDDMLAAAAFARDDSGLSHLGHACGRRRWAAYGAWPRLLPDGRRSQRNPEGRAASGSPSRIVAPSSRSPRLDFLDRLQNLYRVCEEWNLDITFDTSHAASFGLNIVSALDVVYPRFANIHLSDRHDEPPRDCVGYPEFALTREHQLPGSGALPLGMFLQRLRAKRYHGAVTLEFRPLALASWHRQTALDRTRSAVSFVRDHTAASAALPMSHSARGTRVRHWRTTPKWCIRHVRSPSEGDGNARNTVTARSVSASESAGIYSLHHESLPSTGNIEIYPDLRHKGLHAGTALCGTARNRPVVYYSRRSGTASIGTDVACDTSRRPPPRSRTR